MRIRHATGNPADLMPLMGVSNGQFDRFGVVIIAVTKWPDSLLKSSDESTKAGRFFCCDLSLNGNGMTMISNGL